MSEKTHIHVQIASSILLATVVLIIPITSQATDFANTVRDYERSMDDAIEENKSEEYINNLRYVQEQYDLRVNFSISALFFAGFAALFSVLGITLFYSPELFTKKRWKTLGGPTQLSVVNLSALGFLLATIISLIAAVHFTLAIIICAFVICATAFLLWPTKRS